MEDFRKIFVEDDEDRLGRELALARKAANRAATIRTTKREQGPHVFAAVRCFSDVWVVVQVSQMIHFPSRPGVRELVRLACLPANLK
jgi:hypothetical protein